MGMDRFSLFFASQLSALADRYLSDYIYRSVLIASDELSITSVDPDTSLSVQR